MRHDGKAASAAFFVGAPLMHLDPPPPRLPLAGWLLVLLGAVYLCAGLLDHDPWKTEDAIHLGVAWEFARGGNWLTPRIGIDPWFGTPPLYHWTAAALGMLLDFALPFHAAARLASALFGAALLIVLSLAARRLAGEGNARAAPLLAIGSIGLLVPIHDAQPMIALLAAQAGFYLGLARIPGAPLRGSAIAAAALGTGLLCYGLLAALFLAPTAIVVLLHPHWRQPRSIGALLLALLAGTAVGALWPLALAWQSPQALAAWWQAESADFVLQTLDWPALRGHLELLGWSAWPLLPLALWTLWAERRRLGQPATFLPLVGSGLTLAAIVLFSEPRMLQHLPLVTPLCLLATQGVDRLRRGAANAFDWFGMMTFTLVAGLVWLGGIAMATGEPARIARNFTRAEPGFVGQFSWPAAAAAAIASGLWLLFMFRAGKSPWRSVSHWAAGIVLMWTLLAALWMPWLDYGKTYRPLSQRLMRAIGGGMECVTARNLGDAQKASFRYFAGIDLRRSDGCPWLLVQGRAGKEEKPAGWNKVWEGNRPGDKSEKFRLYRRD